MALSETQIEHLIAKSNIGLIQRAWGLSLVAESARYIPEYSADDQWTASVVLTTAGQKIADWIRAHEVHASNADVRMALWGYFAYEQLLVDCEKSHLDTIAHLIWTDIINSRAFVPFIHGRVLYDIV